VILGESKALLVGINCPINSCKEAKLPEPEISEMNGGIQVTLFNNMQIVASERIRNDFGTNSEKRLQSHLILSAIIPNIQLSKLQKK
jgi:hypothetical protein